MSYSYTQRKKTIRRFKKLYGKEKWYGKFREFVAELEKARLGPVISLLDAMLISRSV